MNKEQTLNILEAIKTNYQNFRVDEKTLNFWHFAMKDMNYQEVSKNLMRYVVTNKFAPTIAEIAAYPPKEDKSLKRLVKREEEASRVPQHKLDEFRESFKKLMESKQNG